MCYPELSLCNNNKKCTAAWSRCRSVFAVLLFKGLNDRFAMFIDKVRHLEQQNKGLELELATLRQKQSEPSRIAQLYQQELKDLRSQVEELSRDKNRFLVERNNVEDELQVNKQREKDSERPSV